MPIQQHPFEALAPSGEDGEGEATKIVALEILGAFNVIIRDHIIFENPGKIAAPIKIAARLLVLHALTNPAEFRSLAAIASHLNCSRAWLSKIGLTFANTIGMRASWQRVAARKIYSARAKGVHDGTWSSTEDHDLKKLRASSRKQAKRRAAKNVQSSGV